MSRIGRNAPCPCGSGKKYKKCHGDVVELDRIAKVMAEVPKMRARHEARELQRTQQQGLGRPIISTDTPDGGRVVAVGNQLLHSKKWKTFHDFLVDYLKTITGAEWGQAELSKPLDQRHPILVWYQKMCEQQRRMTTDPSKVNSAQMIGAVEAYLQLAYDLYALAHNAKLQATLLERLRNQDNFYGARYEVQVAATLVRAGFTLAFENESDRSTSHCEFTATYTRTGKQFSVEAKRAEGSKINRQLVRALKKAAHHARIVFIDLNVPAEEVQEGLPPYLQRSFDLLRRFELLDPLAKRLPPAYVFLTNTPLEHHLDEVRLQRAALSDGFHIPEFKADHEYPSLRAALDGRQAHIEMHALLKSMREHTAIPSTFDGDNPELAFEASVSRLLIGDRYRVPDGTGAEVDAVLMSAVVMEVDKTAWCVLVTDDGRQLIMQASLSDAEFAAWKKHPHTFFGEISRNRETKSVMDLYDFLMQTYSKTPKEKLLEFLAEAPDIEHLATLDQAALASIYCERMAANLAVQSGMPARPEVQSKWRPKPSSGAGAAVDDGPAPGA